MTLSSRVLSNSDGKTQPMSKIPIDDRIERFLGRKFRTSRSYATKTAYRGSINKFAEFSYQDYNHDFNELIHKILNQTIDPIEVLNDYYTYLTKIQNPLTKKTGYSNATIRQYVTTAKEFLNDCGCKIYSEDLKQAFKLPRNIVTLSEGLTKSIISQILRLANYKLATVILIACSSGMRIGEIVSLRLSDIDFNTKPTTVKIRAETTKTRESRITHISSEAADALKDYLGKTKRTDFVFLVDYYDKQKSLEESKNNNGKLYQKMKKKYEGLSSEEKLYFRINVTKHNFENQLRRLKTDIPGLSKRAENGRFNIHFHAFRYFFKTQVTDAHESDFAEALMGHKSLKLVYYRQNDEKRRRTYLDVEHSLTISDTEKIDQNYSVMQKDNLELRGIVDSLSRQLRNLEKRIEIRN